MRKLVLAITLSFLGLSASANELASAPPAGYPVVNGIVKRIDIANKQVTLKHEAIPNIGMPGMTMPFLINDEQFLKDLLIGDQVKFSADQNDDGDLVIVWLSKVQQVPASFANTVFCTGAYGKSPKINIEVEVRKKRYSTIRYEYADGSYKGTAYVNSIGDMGLKRSGRSFFYSSSDSELATKLIFDINERHQIQNARFYKYRPGADFIPVECRFER